MSTWRRTWREGKASPGAAHAGRTATCTMPPVQPSQAGARPALTRCHVTAVTDMWLHGAWRAQQWRHSHLGDTPHAMPTGCTGTKAARRATSDSKPRSGCAATGRLDAAARAPDCTTVAGTATRDDTSSFSHVSAAPWSWAAGSSANAPAGRLRPAAGRSAPALSLPACSDGRGRIVPDLWKIWGERNKTTGILIIYPPELSKRLIDPMAYGDPRNFACRFGVS